MLVVQQAEFEKIKSEYDVTILIIAFTLAKLSHNTHLTFEQNYRIN